MSQLDYHGVNNYTVTFNYEGTTQARTISAVNSATARSLIRSMFYGADVIQTELIKGEQNGSSK